MPEEVMFDNIAELQKLLRGAANSQSIAMLNSVMAETIGMSMHNAVSTQHNAQMLNSAATTSTCAKILSVIGVMPGQPPVPPPAPPTPTPTPPAPNPPDTVDAAPKQNIQQPDNAGDNEWQKRLNPGDDDDTNITT